MKSYFAIKQGVCKRPFAKVAATPQRPFFSLLAQIRGSSGLEGIITAPYHGAPQFREIGQ
jgi:hypothetical protein